MDSWCLATWMVLNFLCVFAYGAMSDYRRTLISQVTVRNTDLKSCEKDKQMCVIDPRDCDPRPPSAIQESLNLSCYYQMDQNSVTCNWSETFRSPTEPELSLIFRSVRIVYSCFGVFSPLSTLSITAKMKNSVMDTEIWSQPLTIRLYDAVKPSQPVLTVRGSTANSINVTWDSTSEVDCRLRYRANGTQVWTEVADTVPAGEEDQILTYNIKGLLPFTVYGAAVACRGDSNIWSDWSSEVTVRTADMIPSRPVEVCYTVEKNESSGSFQLRLRWQDSNPCDPGSRVLAYQVSYKPEGKKQPPEIWNVTAVTELLEVEPGNYSITVRAFNTAGYGPVAQLYIDTQRVNSLPPVRNLWVTSHFPAKNAVQVHWQNPSGPLVSHSYVQWHPEARPSIGCWITVESWNSSALIDIDPYTPYLISVIPVYGQQCGPSWSLPASLQHGALMEAVQMKLVGVTKKTVTVGWVWQRRSKPIRVGGYRATLRRGSEMHTTSLWLDQWQHTFSQLTPSTEYSLVLLADNISKHTTSVQTSFDEVPVVAAATPLLLLAVVVFIFFLLFRTACKSYFFPTISSPWSSKMGHWLINPPQQKTLDIKVLDIEDYRVMDVLGDKGLILVVPRQEHSSKKDLREDACPLMHTIKLDVCVSEFATKRENSANDGFLRRGGEEEEEENALNQFSEGLCQECDFSEGMTKHNSHMTCETEYIFVEQISPPLKQ